MADIHCKFCGEPWDIDSLHDMQFNPRCYASEILTYTAASKRFSSLGCGAFMNGKDHCRERVVNPQTALQAVADQMMSVDADDWID